ncbi:MAG: GAF domain-containing protein [Anaerolineae bacterium]|nr:GAF domain-containing protein [Anaerolineae bacterium]
MTERVVSEETYVVNKDQWLSAIFEIAKILATQDDLESILSRFLSCLIDTLEAAETGILLLYNQADDQLTVRDAQGYDLDILKQIRLVPGEAMSGRALQSGQIERYTTLDEIVEARANLAPTNRDLFKLATIGLQEPSSAVCVPLITGQTKVGALVLENRSGPTTFAKADLPFLEAVAQLIALSIDNVRLRDELQTVRALEEANRLKAELISTLAHEMRTPLTSIKGFSTALLMEEATFEPDTQQEFLQIIDDECDVLTDLIHDLLESSIIDAGLLRLELEPVILSRLIESVVSDITRQSERHHIVIDFPAHFPIVDADPGRITQVLRNLLDNAIKYSPQGGMIVVRGEVQAAQIVVSVADQGVGIAPEHLNRLFEKFFRVESGLGKHVVGSGLGLPISQTIVESHSGRIWAESKLGQGSTFYFTIPLQMDEEQAYE